MKKTATETFEILNKRFLEGLTELKTVATQAGAEAPNADAAKK